MSLSPQPIFFDFRSFLPQKPPDSQKLSHRNAISADFMVHSGAPWCIVSENQIIAKY
jgi:hypothetical protein